MFYDLQIMDSKSLKNAWRAGNNQELSPEDVPLPKVCTRLDSWIASDYADPSRRLSLRTSSILVDGAAKLYQQGLADLVQDMYKLEYQMITRKRPRDFSTEDLDDSSTSEFEQPNVAAPLGHSASPVRADSSDGQSGKSGKNRNSQRSFHKKSKSRSSVSLATTLNERSSRASNEELPIGQVFIYKGLGSLLPSKIIVGSVNPEIRKKIKF